MQRLAKCFLATTLLSCLVGPVQGEGAPVAKRLTPPITPQWALECWLWEADSCTAAAITELLEGYEKHDLPVRTIIIDAPWSTRYNDFRIDETRYPNPDAFFVDLKKRGIRVVMWMTSRVNSENSNTRIKDSSDWFAEARAKGFLAGGGYEQHWWLGWGGFVDYDNPEAMKWWRGMQQQVFHWGIDGWKLDDASLFFNSLVGNLSGTRGMPPLAERKGWQTTRQYMDHFYRDEYHHGQKQRGKDFITLSRSIDTNGFPKGFAPLDVAPVTWVGDQNHTWKANEEGIEEALHYILQAARVGYCVIGSDVGGYHGPKIIPPNLYIRWAQLSAFCGLFLNGGHGERALWKRSKEELEIIRKFAWLHEELVPFMYSHVVKCHNGGKPLMRPLGGGDKIGRDLGDFHYMFGDDFLIAPIHEDSLTRKVSLPAGRWRYFFDDKELTEGPATLTRDFPLDEFPVYVREGSVVPLHVRRNYTGLGDKTAEGWTTWNIYPSGDSSFTLHHRDGAKTHARVKQGETLEIELTGKGTSHRLRVFLEREPRQIARNDVVLMKGKDWRYDGNAQRLWIDSPEPAIGQYVVTF